MAAAVQVDENDYFPYNSIRHADVTEKKRGILPQKNLPASGTELPVLNMKNG
jgi:hypothetical protein